MNTQQFVALGAERDWPKYEQVFSLTGLNLLSQIQMLKGQYIGRVADVFQR